MKNNDNRFTNKLLTSISQKNLLKSAYKRHSSFCVGTLFDTFKIDRLTFITRSILRCALIYLVYESSCFALAHDNSTLPTHNKTIHTQRALKNSPKPSKHNHDSHNAWSSAVRYCKEARLGDIEAQYQLGMLYAFGSGVPKHRAYAAALFSLAGGQGHYKAQNMLENIRLISSTLPDCMNSASIKPEKALQYSVRAIDNIDIETRLSHLPKHKTWIVDLVKTMSAWYKIDPKFVLSIISVESNFEPNARSPKNAMGLMQMIPATSERFNVGDAFNVSQNIQGGLKYLQWLINRYKGDVAMVAAGYNAGEGAVDRHHGIPPYPETQNYVAQVLRLYQKPVLHSSQH
jgi:hypothetical protein